MIKELELSDPNSCINRAQEGEPVFVLRSSDIFAPLLIDQWIRNMEANGKGSSAKVVEAKLLLASMQNWQLNHTVKVPD